MSNPLVIRNTQISISPVAQQTALRDGVGQKRHLGDDACRTQLEEVGLVPRVEVLSGESRNGVWFALAARRSGLARTAKTGWGGLLQFVASDADCEAGATT